MEVTDPRGYYEDVLGFTNQTAILLTGIRAKELLPQFKQKNISTELLAELTVEDLQLLGADLELANHMHKELATISRRISRLILTPQGRLDQLSEALIYTNKHLSLIHAFVTYARLRIKEERIDSFVERNSNLRSSRALELAVDATISEIHDARLALEKLELLLDDSSPSRSQTFYIAMFGGVGLIALVLLRNCISSCIV